MAKKRKLKNGKYDIFSDKNTKGIMYLADGVTCYALTNKNKDVTEIPYAEFKRQNVRWLKRQARIAFDSCISLVGQS